MDDFNFNNFLQNEYNKNDKKDIKENIKKDKTKNKTNESKSTDKDGQKQSFSIEGYLSGIESIAPDISNKKEDGDTDDNIKKDESEISIDSYVESKNADSTQIDEPEINDVDAPTSDSDDAIDEQIDQFPGSHNEQDNISDNAAAADESEIIPHEQVDTPDSNGQENNGDNVTPAEAINTPEADEDGTLFTKAIEINSENDFPYDAGKKFNAQQDPVFFPERPLIEVLEEKRAGMIEEMQYRLDHPEEFEEEIKEVLTDDLDEDMNALADALGTEGISIDGKALKKSQKKTKFQRPISQEKLIKKGFPKLYFDPTDAEFDDKTKKYNYFYNIEKTLRKNNMLWLTKIIPMNILIKLTYDNSLFDAYADRQHNLAVKLNSMGAEDQYRFELRRRTMRILCTFVILCGCVVYFLFSSLPNNNYGKAIKMFENKKWALSMQEFKNVGDFKDSTIYYNYANAKLNQGNKSYDKALEIFEKIKPYANNIDVDIEEDIKETKYLKGVDLYTQHKYNEAIKVLREVEKHKEASEYINKAQYAIAEAHYDKSEYKDALDIFYALGKFSDAQERSSTIAEELYKTAESNYNNGKYKAASENFILLSRYNYKNSKNMVNQVVYKIGLDEYLEGNFEKARDEFAKIIRYKDSDAMYKEATYNIAKRKYGNSIESSLEEFLKISDYKDVPVFLNRGVFTLFGEWKIVEMNGEKSDELTFKFTNGGKIESESEIMYAAISTEDDPIEYKWNGKEYEALDGVYKISTERINGQTINVTFKEGNNSVTFTCVEEKDYLSMMNKNSDTSIEDQEKSDALTDLIQNYVNKKTDGETIAEQEKIQ